MDSQKIKLEICCGTTCYMLGGAALLKLERSLPEEWLHLLDFSAAPCMNSCSREDLGRAPFVRLNGELIGNASEEKVYRLIAEIIERKDALHE